MGGRVSTQDETQIVLLDAGDDVVATWDYSLVNLQAATAAKVDGQRVQVVKR